MMIITRKNQMYSITSDWSVIFVSKSTIPSGLKRKLIHLEFRSISWRLQFKKYQMRYFIHDIKSC